MKTVAAPIDECLSRIEEAARQALYFANQIAGFSATHSVKKEQRDLNDLVHTASHMIDIARFDPAGKIRIVDRLTRDKLECEVFASSFSQCVRNIINNAYQALRGKDGGTITLSSERGSGPYEGRAVIRFKDNGPGIQPEHIERIFEAEFTTKTGDTGSGVGLWLVRDQLKIVDGTISVESEPGAGATFIVSVPLSMAQGES
jgi:signal transduction histidine kinase